MLDEVGGQGCDESIDSFGYFRQALGPVISGVHARNYGQQNLGGTDIAGGLLPPNVLFPGL